jgi:hypothetical protein
MNENMQIIYRYLRIFRISGEYTDKQGDTSMECQSVFPCG